MNKFIPLSSLKDTTGIVELCKNAGEPVVVNRNGELKLVIMTKDIFNEYFHVKNKEYYLDVILINKFKKPAQVVCKCESINKEYCLIRFISKT